MEAVLEQVGDLVPHAVVVGVAVQQHDRRAGGVALLVDRQPYLTGGY
ncbi:hypothetical protein [Nonomuraea recticatena]